MSYVCRLSSFPAAAVCPLVAEAGLEVWARFLPVPGRGGAGARPLLGGAGSRPSGVCGGGPGLQSRRPVYSWVGLGARPLGALA